MIKKKSKIPPFSAPQNGEKIRSQEEKKPMVRHASRSALPRIKFQVGKIY